MAYSAQITRLNPTCMIFLLDQSGSMQDPFGRGDGTKAKGSELADMVNRILANLVIRCSKAEGVRDYFEIGVLRYGADVGSAFIGPLAGRELVPISQLADSPVRIEPRTKRVPDGAGGLVDQPVKFPVWVDPVSNGGTPMCQALDLTRDLLQRWLAAHPDAYPPRVLHITDGEPTDGDPSAASQSLTELRSSDGNVVLFNCHLSDKRAAPSEFPDSEAGLVDTYALTLFRMSSLLPPETRDAAQREGFPVSETTRGYVFNADPEAAIRFLDIGTKAANLR